MKKQYTITRNKKTVSIELPIDHYEHLCIEAKQVVEVFLKDSNVTLQDISNAMPVLFVLIPSAEVVKTLNVGDKVHF